MVVYLYNPSYSEGRDQKNCSLRQRERERERERKRERERERDHLNK
jgi:hypothetical protein